MPKLLNLHLSLSDIASTQGRKNNQFTLSIDTEKLLKIVKEQPEQEQNVKADSILKKTFSLMDFDRWYNVVFLVIIRTLMAIYSTTNFVHPDEYYQGTEVAYDVVFGNVMLTWEWWDENRIRGIIYPLYLSIFLKMLKFFEIDSAQTVRLSYYFAHEILVVIGDVIFFRTVKKLEGAETARLTMYLYLTLKNFNLYYVKCFGNSVETFLSILIFYYLTSVSRKLNGSLVLAVGFMVLQMFIRCTSSVAWIPLLLFKVYQHPKLFHKYILVGFYVAIPLFSYFVYLDSRYYGRFTISLYNFVQKNIVEDISSKYGVSEASYYIFRTLPYSFNFATIPLFYSFIRCIINSIKTRNLTSYIIYPVTLITMLSCVPHKEDRFILPAIPYLILLVAVFYRDAFKKKFGLLFRFLFFITVIYEIIIFIAYSRYQQRRQDPFNFINSIDQYPPSFYHANRFDIPYYALTHNREKQGARYFSKGHSGNFGGVTDYIYPEDNIYQCKDVINALKKRWWPPKYVIINQIFNNPSKDCCKSKEEYLEKKSKLFQQEDCTRELDLEGGYKLIRVFSNEVNNDLAFLKEYGIDIDWEYYLRVEFQSVYVYQHQRFIDYSQVEENQTPIEKRKRISKPKYPISVYLDVYNLLFIENQHQQHNNSTTLDRY